MPHHVLKARQSGTEAELACMLEARVILESSSQCSSPIVVVPKTDGSLRLCSNFGKLNEVTDFDSYSIP